MRVGSTFLAPARSGLFTRLSAMTKEFASVRRSLVGCPKACFDRPRLGSGMVSIGGGCGGVIANGTVRLLCGGRVE